MYIMFCMILLSTATVVGPANMINCIVTDGLWLVKIMHKTGLSSNAGIMCRDKPQLRIQISIQYSKPAILPK